MPINKKELISYCEEIKKEIDVYKAIKDSDNTKENGVGTSQFRDLASICKTCDTYDEILLLIKYKIAKDDKNISWRQRIGGKEFGTVVLSKIEKIRNQYDDNEVLTAISLFFGYLYQSSKIWRSEASALTYNSKKK